MFFTWNGQIQLVVVVVVRSTGNRDRPQATGKLDSSERMGTAHMFKPCSMTKPFLLSSITLPILTDAVHVADASFIWEARIRLTL